MKLWLILFVWGVAGCSSSASLPPEVTPSSPATPASTDVLLVDAVESGFVTIAFTDMAVFPADGSASMTWTAEGDEFLCNGKPKCYLPTQTPVGDGTLRFDDAADAISSAREWADAAPRRAVLVTGSITLVGEAMALASAERWKNK